MLEITKTLDNGSLQKLNLNEAVSGSWFNLINPTREEIQQVSLVLGLDESFLNNSLDADELSRMDFEDGNLLVITNVPVMDDEGNFDTLPLGLIFTPESIITVCSHENKIINSFSIVGLMVVGSMAATRVAVDTPLAIKVGEGVTKIQTVLNSLAPGLIPLGITMLVWWMLRKKVNTLWIIVAIFVVGIIGYYTGILGYVG